MNVSLIGSISEGKFSIESKDYSDIYGFIDFQTRIYTLDLASPLYSKNMTYISNLEIYSNFQNKGYASSAMYFIFKELNNLSSEGIYLTPIPKNSAISQKDLISFYQKLGFVNCLNGDLYLLF